MRYAAHLAAVVLALAWCGCTVGPRYTTPAAPAPVAFKEPPPDGWKEAQPADGELKGKWWEIFGDPILNSYEEQVSISNQNVLVAEAQYREAKAAVKVARSALFPSITGRVSNSEARVGRNNNTTTNNQNSSGSSNNTNSSSNTTGNSPLVNTANTLGIDATWELDLWGGIRRGVTAGVDLAQASAAQLEGAKLIYQAELAQDYFQLRALDTQTDLLTRTVASYQDSVRLTQTRFDAGVISEVDVKRAQTQLYAAQTSLTDLGVARAAFEHAIAVLTGKAPSQVTLTGALLKTAPPPIPVGAPSSLLERRPDIATSERNMAAANEEIGIARAAYFPNLTLTGSIGFAATSFAKWFGAPSAFWSVGPGLAGTLLDFGRRKGQLESARAAYAAQVATYRQTVLTALQQVEDNLAALRILERESAFEQETIVAATRTLELTNTQYLAGTASYLDVITAQTALLDAQSGAVQLLGRRMVASVLLIEALGGGWKSSSLPDRQGVMSNTASASHD